jgi:hypothetical protein
MRGRGDQKRRPFARVRPQLFLRGRGPGRRVVGRPLILRGRGPGRRVVGRPLILRGRGP